mmetsp:Transcript_100956/g.289840  ORF Transcript_100956/g.289840 Transcript_100956/m.289840 type:complete len:231 (+) Transcript_100956:1741-2433(+)
MCRVSSRFAHRARARRASSYSWSAPSSMSAQTPHALLVVPSLFACISSARARQRSRRSGATSTSRATRQRSYRSRSAPGRRTSPRATCTATLRRSTSGCCVIRHFHPRTGAFSAKTRSGSSGCALASAATPRTQQSHSRPTARKWPRMRRALTTTTGPMSMSRCSLHWPGAAARAPASVARMRRTSAVCRCSVLLSSSTDRYVSRLCQVRRWCSYRTTAARRRANSTTSS